MLVHSRANIYPGEHNIMSLDPLVELIHSTQSGEWNKRNEDAFSALFGSPEGRYPEKLKQYALG